jgi:hypothetical protein
MSNRYGVCTITARQLREVVLPGEAIRSQVPVPRASGARKCPGGKPGMARVFAVQVQILLGAGALAVQV